MPAAAQRAVSGTSARCPPLPWDSHTLPVGHRGSEQDPVWASPKSLCDTPRLSSLSQTPPDPGAFGDPRAFILSQGSSRAKLRPNKAPGGEVCFYLELSTSLPAPSTAVWVQPPCCQPR